MAIIGKIRKRSGLLVIIIGVALAAFVLGDFLKPGKSARKQNYIGKVAGENISYNEFAQKVEEQLENIKQRAQKEKLTSDEVFSARQMTWNQLTNDLIMGEEYETMGITVSSDELFDLVQGKNPHPYILQYFKDPKTQQYNPSLVINFLKQLDQMEPKQKNSWLQLEKAIKDDRLKTKFNNLLSKGYYVPKLFAQADYTDKNRRFDVRVVPARYQMIDDKTITLTDADYQKYYDENKNQYDQEATRDLEYVLFEIQPSAIDRAKIAKDVELMWGEFQKAGDVGAYVNANSDTKLDSSWKKAKTLPPMIDSVLFNSTVGTFVPPYIENNMYHMAKLLKVQMRPDSMKASHILISYTGSAVNDPKITRTKVRAKQIADSIATVLKKDINQFPGLCAKFNDDATAKEKGGDLGWFTDGTMVYAFNEAVVEGKTGDLKTVETPFGYHVIRITDKKAPVKKIQVAMLDRRIEPSSQTFQEIYTKASEFAGSNTTIESFEKACLAKGYNKRMAEQVKAMDNSIPGVNGSRSVIQWAFQAETKKGAVSAVFEVEGNYVVATVKEQREKGIPTLEQIKSMIEPLVRRDKKAEKLIADIKNAGTKDLYALATKLNSKVDTVPNVIFFSYNLPKYGPEPEVIGSIVNMKAGAVSEPIKGNQAVYVVMLDKITEAPEMKDFKMNAKQLEYNFAGRVQQEAYKALEKKANIEDNRVLFY